MESCISRDVGGGGTKVLDVLINRRINYVHRNARGEKERKIIIFENEVKNRAH